MNEGTSRVSEVSTAKAMMGPAFGGLSTVTGADAALEARNETPSAARFDSKGLKHVQPGRHYPRDIQTQRRAIDSALLTQAEETLATLKDADDLSTQLLLTSLVGVVSDMWESTASLASEIHQEILATLENAVRSAATRGRSLSADELLAIRSGLTYLGQARLVRSNAESVRSEFVEVGFPPMGFLE